MAGIQQETTRTPDWRISIPPAVDISAVPCKLGICIHKCKKREISA